MIEGLLPGEAANIHLALRCGTTYESAVLAPDGSFAFPDQFTHGGTCNLFVDPQGDLQAKYLPSYVGRVAGTFRYEFSSSPGPYPGEHVVLGAPVVRPRLSGTVITPDGAALSDDVLVQVRPDFEGRSTAIVQDTGVFTLDDLRPGSEHDVRVNSQSGPSSYAAGWYSAGAPGNFSFYWVEATRLVLAPGEVIDDLEITLRRCATVTGTIVGLPSGQSGEVHVVDTHTWLRRTAAFDAGPGRTSATFAVPGVAPGSHAVAVLYSDSGREVERWLNGNDYETPGPEVLEVDRTCADVGGVYFALGAPIKPGSPPLVSGTPQVGEVLTASSSTWDVASPTLTYQWLGDGVPLRGATERAYTVAPADLGSRLSVLVTASAAGRAPGEARSEPTEAVAAGDAPVVTTPPKVTGTAEVGQKLTASRGSWSLPGLTYSYRWLRDGAHIPGATSSTYRLTAKDAGRKVQARVVVRRDGYSTATATSSARKVTKISPTVDVRLPSPMPRGAAGTASVTVKTAATSAPTGTVKITVAGATVTKNLPASARGTVAVRLPKVSKAGATRVTVTFTPSSATARSTAARTLAKTLRVV
ncbi:hypothetical protein J4G33_12975 [Actinotalea sp. BY-33]|uniref:Ig-like domain repeat protein n=1 Tax=Actinotalea soli TaxID=2819234 RepID=A0A939LTI4_9CELL|nr:hypothetical protein [Actinotalea soli]MBO1752720.1 hypothetical protein [Actinotalea soli]